MNRTEILLVEDDPDHADLIIDVLETEGVKKKILLLKDGREVIDYFQNVMQTQVSLVILDLNLPKVHGMDVLKFIKKNSKYCSIPVVIFSTSSNHKTIDEAYKNGANGYIRKPISYQEFVEKIRTLKKYC